MRLAYMAVLLSLLAPSLAVGQSLDEAARKEKERRRKLQESSAKSSNVVNEEDLKANKGSLSNKPESAAASTANESANEARTASTGDKNQEEQLWRDRVARAESRLADAKQRYETLSGLTLVQGQYYVDKDGKRVITSLEDLRQKIERAKAESDAAQKDLDAVLEAARRTGVPPGWLR
jgi:hypothetical protein